MSSVIVSPCPGRFPCAHQRMNQRMSQGRHYRGVACSRTLGSLPSLIRGATTSPPILGLESGMHVPGSVFRDHSQRMTQGVPGF